MIEDSIVTTRLDYKLTLHKIKDHFKQVARFYNITTPQGRINQDAKEMEYNKEMTGLLLRGKNEFKYNLLQTLLKELGLDIEEFRKEEQTITFAYEKILQPTRLLSETIETLFQNTSLFGTDRTQHKDIIHQINQLCKYNMGIKFKAVRIKSGRKELNENGKRYWQETRNYIAEDEWFTPYVKQSSLYKGCAVGMGNDEDTQMGTDERDDSFAAEETQF